MASIKVTLESPLDGGKEGMLCYQLTYQKDISYIYTPFKIKKEEWDPANEQIIHQLKEGNRKAYLDSINSYIKKDKHRFRLLIKNLNDIYNAYSIKDITGKFTQIKRESSLYTLFEIHISNYKKRKQYRTSETYASTLNSIKRFRNYEDTDILDLSKEFILSYKYYLLNLGLCPNTVSFYLHRLRAIHNKAIETGLTDNFALFKNIKISYEKTVKRALDIEQIRHIKTLDLCYCPSRCFARDMFLFSFYTRGMSFIDIAYLKKTDLRGNILSYRRRKTGQLLSILWEPCMQEIIDRYKSDTDSPYMLNIINHKEVENRTEYHNKLTQINRNLKSIGKSIGIRQPLTMYVARHSWATTAHNNGIPISVISEGMGHDNEKTTQIYLASIERNIIDNANRKIIQLLNM